MNAGVVKNAVKAYQNLWWWSRLYYNEWARISKLALIVERYRNDDELSKADEFTLLKILVQPSAFLPLENIRYLLTVDYIQLYSMLDNLGISDVQLFLHLSNLKFHARKLIGIIREYQPIFQDASLFKQWVGHLLNVKALETVDFHAHDGIMLLLTRRSLFTEDAVTLLFKNQGHLKALHRVFDLLHRNNAINPENIQRLMNIESITLLDSWLNDYFHGNVSIIEVFSASNDSGKPGVFRVNINDWLQAFATVQLNSILPLFKLYHQIKALNDYRVTLKFVYRLMRAHDNEINTYSIIINHLVGLRFDVEKWLSFACIDFVKADIVCVVLSVIMRKCVVSKIDDEALTRLDKTIPQENFLTDLAAFLHRFNPLAIHLRQIIKIFLAKPGVYYHLLDTFRRLAKMGIELTDVQLAEIFKLSPKRVGAFLSSILTLAENDVCSSLAIDKLIFQIGNKLPKKVAGTVGLYVGVVDEKNPHRKIVLDNEEYRVVESAHCGNAILGGIAAVNKTFKPESQVDTFFATKRLFPNASHPKKNLSCIQREAKYLNLLGHEAKACTNQELYVVVMPWVDGENLAKIDPDSLLATPLKQRVKAFIYFVSDVANLHALGRVHGDIKPQNAIFETPDKLHLIDFNSAHREYSNKNYPITKDYVDHRRVEITTARMVDDIHALSYILKSLFPELVKVNPSQSPITIAFEMFIASVIICNPKERCIIKDVLDFFIRVEKEFETITLAELLVDIDNIEYKQRLSDHDVLSGRTLLLKK